MLQSNKEDQSQKNPVPWWQEAQEKPALAPVTTIEEPENVLSSEVRDIGEELEEEARQRALLTPNEVVIPLDMVAGYRQDRRSVGFTGFGFMALYTILLVVASFFITRPITPGVLVSSAMLWILVIGFYVLFLYAEKKGGNSAVTLSPVGIRIVAPLQTVGPIFWDEIAQIRPLFFHKQRYIAIIPKDESALAKRLGRPSSLSEDYDHDYSDAKRAFFAAPIRFAVRALPMTEEEFLAQVQAYRCREGGANEC